MSTIWLSEIDITKLRDLAEERRWEVRTPVKVDWINETSRQQRKSSASFATDRTRASSVATDREDLEPNSHVPTKEKRHVWLINLQALD